MSDDVLISGDGLRLRRRRWPATSAARATVVIAHGYGEHAGRYSWFASQLNAAGYTVDAIDARGHGESEGERMLIRSLDTLAEDLGRLCEAALAQDRAPLFILGHSLGSLVAIKTALQRQPMLAGLLLSGNALDGRSNLPAPAFGILRALSYLVPRLRLLPALRAEDISTDAEVVSAYLSDPLVDHGRWRVLTGSVVMQAIQECRDLVPQLTLPLYVMHGGSDRMLSPEGARFAVEHTGSTDKTLKIHAQEFHEPLSGVTKADVVADLLAWLDQHVDEATASDTACGHLQT